LEISENKDDSKNASIILKIWLLVLFVINISLSLYTLNKGLDITDEAFYLMGYKFPYESINYFSFYHQIVGQYFSFMPLTLVNVRVLKLFIFLLSALIFSIGLSNSLKGYINSFIANPTLIFLFVSNLSFASFALGPQSLSYNSISASCLMLICGLSLIICSQNLSRFYYFLASICMGFFIAMIFYVKFTNSLILLPIIFLLFFKLKKYRSYKVIFFDILKFILCIFTGITIFIFSFFKTLEIAKTKTANYVSFIIETSKNSDHHNSTELLNKYIVQLNTKFNQLIIEYYPLLVLGILLLSFGIFKSNKWTRVVYVLVSFAFVYLFFYSFKIYTNFAESTIIDPFLICLIILLVYSFIFHLRQKRIPQEMLKVFFLLIFAIIFGVVGTNNEITTQFVFYINLIAGIYIVCLSINKIKSNLVSFYLIIISTTGSYTYVNGTILNPYRIDGTLFTQDRKLLLDDSTEIKIDNKLWSLIDSVKTDLYTKTKFNSNFPIYCNSHEIGIVYSLGSYVPSVQWNTTNNFNTAYKFFIQSKSPDIMNCCFLISNIEPVDSTFFKLIEKQNIFFERDYISLGAYTVIA
jgi:hypothetical protein